jgi:cyclic pyranopterin phosphate synthase
VDDKERLTHVDQHGTARMVDVDGKTVTHRRAVAGAFIHMHPETLAMIAEGLAPKGDVFAVARVAGIMAAKRTSELIPLCHQLSITRASVDFEPMAGGVNILATVETNDVTGVEMEALTAAGVAALTLYDMCKAVDRGMIVDNLGLVEKNGGRSGRWTREEEVQAMPLPPPGVVVSVNLSARKTVRKTRGQSGTLVFDRGFEGDAHAGDWHRQVSLLGQESIDKMVARGLRVGPGDFAENITTSGINLLALPVGTVIAIGDSSKLEISQMGKVCHTRCAIYYQAGDCVMPREGLFAVVRGAGEVRIGDAIQVVTLGDGSCDRTPASAIAEFEAERAAEAAAQFSGARSPIPRRARSV